MGKLDLGHIAELLKKGDIQTLKRFKETKLNSSDEFANECENFSHLAVVDAKLEYTEEGYLNFDFTITPKKPGVLVCNIYGMSSNDDNIAGTINSQSDSESTLKPNGVIPFYGLLSAPYKSNIKETITARFIGSIQWEDGTLDGICFSKTININ